MSGTLLHKSLSAKPDTPDTSLIGSGKWGEEHVFAGGSGTKLLQWDAAESDKVSWTDSPTMLNPTMVNPTVTGLLTLADGTVAAPTTGFASEPTLGWYRVGFSQIGLGIGGISRVQMSSSAFSLIRNDLRFQFGANADLRLERDAAATLQLGTDAAAPVAQMFKAHDGSGTDSAGASLTLTGGNGTGTGLGGALIFATTPAGSTGSSQNTSTERARFTSPGHFVLAELTTNPGTGDLAADAATAVYTKADKFVIAYNNGGTLTYISIPLDGSTTTWTHSTVAP
jgi:hypothetical protein